MKRLVELALFKLGVGIFAGQALATSGNDPLGVILFLVGFLLGFLLYW